MKNLGKTIDRLIKIDQNFKGKLIPIKNKWKRCPSKTMDYWKELLDFLNSGFLISHPKQIEIKNIIVSKKQISQQIYSFEKVTPTDKIIGIIPENIADLIRKQDRQSVRIAKLHVEANMTRNKKLMAEVSRKELILEINIKKLWVRLRDHFQLWGEILNCIIRVKDGALFLVGIVSPPTISPNGPNGPGIIKMGPDMLKNFFRFMGLDLPPDLSNEE